MKDKAIITFDTKGTMSDDTRNSMVSAAERWEADFFEVRESDAPFAHQGLKMCAFDFCDHDRLLIIDADTIMRHDVPNLFDLVPEDQYGATKNNQAHHPGVYLHQNPILAKMQIESIVDSGRLVNPERLHVDWLAQNFFNSGVTVVHRQHHALVLSYAFNLFTSVTELSWWDQMALNVAVQVLLPDGYYDFGSNWNYMFPQDRNKMSAYIYHFAGDPGRYTVLDGGINWQA